MVRGGGGGGGSNWTQLCRDVALCSRMNESWVCESGERSVCVCVCECICIVLPDGFQMRAEGSG